MTDGKSDKTDRRKKEKKKMNTKKIKTLYKP